MMIVFISLVEQQDFFVKSKWKSVQKRNLSRKTQEIFLFFNLPEKTHISRLFGKKLSMRDVDLIFSSSVFLKYKLTPVILWKLMISQSWIRKISQRGQFFVLILESFICQHFFEWNVGNKIQSQKGQNTQLNVFTVKRANIHSQMFSQLKGKKSTVMRDLIHS